MGDNIVYKPEFIRLEHVHMDLRCPNYFLMGHVADNEAAQNYYLWLCKHWTTIPKFRMSLIEAELAKITLNCALTMKISLANQLHRVAEKMGCDSSKIMACVGADPRIGNAYLAPGKAYGGPCLPRDNRMFRYVAEQLGITAPLSAAADEINEAMNDYQA